MRRHMVLQRQASDGSRLFDHCVVVEERTGKWPEEYPPPVVPELGADIWEWFWQLRSAAAFGMNGPGPLAFTEIEAWSRLLRVKIGPMEVRLLMVLDQQYLDSWYEEQKRRTPKK